MWPVVSASFRPFASTIVPCVDLLEVYRPVRLPVCERRIRRAVEDLDRPIPQHEDAERDADDEREAADSDEEAWAAEEKARRLASTAEAGRPPVRLRGSVTLRLGSGG